MLALLLALAAPPSTARAANTASGGTATCPSPGASPIRPSPTPAPASNPSAPSGPQSSPSTASRSPSPTPSDPPRSAELCARQGLIDGARQKLTANLTTAVGVQERLAHSLEENGRQQIAIQSGIDAARAELAALDEQMARIAEMRTRTQAAIQRDRQEAGELARSVYRTPDSLLLALLKAQSLGQLISSTADVLSTGLRVQRSERQLSADLQRLEFERSAAMAAQATKRAVESDLEAQSKKLSQLRADQKESARLLAGEIERTQTAINQLQRESGELAREIASTLEAEQTAIVAMAMQQAWAQVILWESTPGRPWPTVSEHHSRKYRFIWPEPAGVVAQKFGPTDLVLAPPYGGYPHFHTGIDIADTMGTPVLAADDGIVAAVGTGTTGYGNYVVLGHRDGFLTLYAHLQSSLVQAGDIVSQRQPIGFEGSSGNSTGPHLHFELRVHDQPNDPAPFLPSGPPSTAGMDGT